MPYRSGSVVLRAVEEEDLDTIAGYLVADESWGARGIRNDRFGPMSRAEIRSQLESWPKPEKGQVLAIEALGTLVGHVETDWQWDAISPSVWVFIVPDARRRGHGRVAADLVIDRLFFETPAATVHAWIDEPSAVGILFAEALGFSPAGRVRRVGIRAGRYFDTIPMQLLRETWESHREG